MASTRALRDSTSQLLVRSMTDFCKSNRCIENFILHQNRARHIPRTLLNQSGTLLIHYQKRCQKMFCVMSATFFFRCPIFAPQILETLTSPGVHTSANKICRVCGGSRNNTRPNDCAARTSRIKDQKTCLGPKILR